MGEQAIVRSVRKQFGTSMPFLVRRATEKLRLLVTVAITILYCRYVQVTLPDVVAGSALLYFICTRGPEIQHLVFQTSALQP